MKFNEIYNSITEQMGGIVSAPKTGIGEIDTIINLLLKDQNIRRGFTPQGIDTAITLLKDPRFIEAYKKANPKHQKTAVSKQPQQPKPSEADLNDRLEADRQVGMPSATDLSQQ